MVEKKKLHIIAYAALGKGLSGGDNILIELSKRWADKLDITIWGGRQIKDASFAKGLQSVRFNICPSKTHFRYLERLFWSLKTSVSPDIQNCIYTASDFPHDLLCGWIIKLRFPRIKWIAGYYLVLCPPFASRSPYRGFSRIRGVGYWLMQKFTLPIVRKWADVVYVTSEPDRKYFKKVVVIKGGVTIIPEMHFAFTHLPVEKREYDAIFIGRFHYQKGVSELIDIWNLVRKWKPDTKLLMIGNGVLYQKCLEKRLDLGLRKNIDFISFVNDDLKKYYFSRSKIIVHPAIFDSGGMACAEGMAYGLPCVGFDLPVYKTYYELGMLKAKNIEEFASIIIELLTNKELYKSVAQEAFDYIREKWDWDRRTEKIWEESGLF